MAIERRTWAAERTWAIKGVSDRTRAAALEAAHACGLTVGAWLEQVLTRAAEEARSPRPSVATREEVAGLLDERLRPVEEALGRIVERLASLEEKAGQRTEAGASHGRIQRKNPRGPRLGLPR
jgi:hypothetical protein